MKRYLDTSAILPALLQCHENHVACQKLLRAQSNGAAELMTAAHTYGEIYRHLTRNIPPFEVAPSLAEKALSELSAIIDFVNSDASLFQLATARCARLNLSGPVIYDALHLETAIAVGAQILFTDNTNDFNRLLMADDAIEIQAVR